MRLQSGSCCLVRVLAVLAIIGAVSGAASIPPGRQHRLSIEGENTITFLPQSNLPPLKIDYKARFEYIVDSWAIKEPKVSSEQPPKIKIIVKDTAGSPRNKVKNQASEAPSKKASRAIDLSLHSSEIVYRQNGQPALETKMSRTRFQGRLQPDSPVLSVSAKEAPPRLQEILKFFDTTAATMLVNDGDKVVDLKLKPETPQRPVIETIVSIHSPMPKDVDSWEASSRLAMGQGQTAKGRLRFEKVEVEKNQEAIEKSIDVGKGELKQSSLAIAKVVKVKVSGVLKGEGIIAENFIKDGTYTVDGEQSYDPETREWIASKWSVDVNNELANQAGLTVAQAKGKMVVESRAVGNSANGTGGEAAIPKL